MYRAVGYLGLFMGAFFIFAGFFIGIKQILTPPLKIFSFEWTYFSEHPDHVNYISGVLLVLYGIFRLYRSYKIIKTNNDF